MTAHRDLLIINQSVDVPVKTHIACFVSPHGFGHAARASAVMAALHALAPETRFEIFTLTPRWFFEDSLTGPFTYHALLTDIGLVQASPLKEDLPQTVQSLSAFLPFKAERVAALAEQLRQLRCQAVLCDIAPLGIAAARAAGLPSVLIENFTWDWIYEGYLADEPRLAPCVRELRSVFASAEHHLQTEPVCAPAARGRALVTRPVSREVRAPRETIRAQLNIPRQSKAVLITMGGLPDRFAFLSRLMEQRGVCFVIPGGSETRETRGNLALLPFRSGFLHADLVNACDAVVGKVGYSTLAEAYQAGVPFGYLRRARFRESDVLAAFIRARMSGLEIDEAEFYDGGWVRRLPELLALPRLVRKGENGAAQAARYIVEAMGLVSA
jgi:hypothetical protein